MNRLSLIVLGCIACFSFETLGQCNKDYQLFWADEFDSTAVDTSQWVLTDAGGGFGNQEIQYYQPENATVSEGLLHIKIAKDTIVDGSTTYNYSSAKLWTDSKINFLYGKIESRIKMPDAVGSWPAFWMLGADFHEVGWPKCGEIDVMEWVGRGPKAATGSIFFEGTWPDNHLSTPYNIPSGESFTTDFHTFAVEWEPNEIRYYCDGNHYATYKNTTIAPKDWLFNHEFFLILNCAIGGTGGGNVISIDSPKYMEVDYVRVYSLPTTADSISLFGPKSLMANSEHVLFETEYFPNTAYDWSLPEGATIEEGEGTNSIYVNFSEEGGDVKVIATSICGTMADSLKLNLLKDTCTIVYDDFDAIRNVSYAASGLLDEQYLNPMQDTINLSTFVAKYERSIEETYDVLSIRDVALESALDYEDDTRVFFMDVFTSAPVGTQITLQLENSAINGGAYPQGRRSSYIGIVSKENGWHTIRFRFNEVISVGTSPNQVDFIALLFDPGHKTNDVYYFDNLKRLKDVAGCDALPVGITKEVEGLTTVYPNPVTYILYFSDYNVRQRFTVYNHLGEIVIEDSGSKIDVSELVSGVYLLKTDSSSFKFVKQ